jgi:hypothetical protein
LLLWYYCYVITCDLIIIDDYWSSQNKIKKSEKARKEWELLVRCKSKEMHNDRTAWNDEEALDWYSVANTTEYGISRHPWQRVRESFEILRCIMWKRELSNGRPARRSLFLWWIGIIDSTTCTTLFGCFASQTAAAADHRMKKNEKHASNKAKTTKHSCA